MKNVSKALVATAVCSALSHTVWAAEADAPVQISANVSLTSDYVFRGYTQTLEDPALQGGFDLSHESGLYLGTWGSNVKFTENGAPDDGASLELDLYGGYKYKVNEDLGLDIGYSRYFYPGSDSNLHYEMGEFYLKGSYQFLTAAYFYSPEFFGKVGNTHYFNLGASYSLPYDVTLGGSVGRQNYSDLTDADYTDWSLSLAKNVGGVDLKLAYTDTNVSGSKLADARAVFSVSKSF